MSARKFSLLILFGLVLASLPGSAVAGQAGPASGGLRPRLSAAVRHDRLPSLLAGDSPASPAWQTASGAVEASPRLGLDLAFQPALQPDPALQAQAPLAVMPPPLFSFDGTSNINGVLPPDTNGDIGPDHYVQWVNLSLQIWAIDRQAGTAVSVYGPRPGSAIWSGFGGPCESSNDGDPVVLYDHLAGRWLISQFALPYYPSGPFYQCIAVSQTGDPTAGWNRYAYLLSNYKMNDYPKLGVWPDGYYLSVNQFEGSLSSGAGVAVFERDKMLLGQPARMVFFDLFAVNSKFHNLLPSDLDGPPPPAGAPNYFASVEDGAYLPPDDALRIWEFHVDWTNPDASTFGLSGQPNQTLPVAAFTPLCLNKTNCIPQPNTNQGVDAIGDRLMHRLQFRFFGSYGALLANHTVDAGSAQAGLRWYELRRSAASWEVYQQGTYAGAPPNGGHRWMGSIAMDRAGNIALGYNLAGASIYPSIAYSGRLASQDNKGQLTEAETLLVSGGGSQTHSSGRWGDYSMLGVDPADDCTFWFTGEYYAFTSTASWRTRIGAFVFPACQAGLKGDLRGRVTNAVTGAPVAGALIDAGGFSASTDEAGYYQFTGLPVGDYDLTASAYGYGAGSAPGVTVSVNAVVTQNFALTPLPRIVVTGTVRDGSGQGWPLYARLDLTAPGMAQSIFTNPQTGAYQVELAQGVEHSFSVSAVSPGYQPQTAPLTPSPGNARLDFNLLVDSGACQAPGYQDSGGCHPVPGSLLNGIVFDENTAGGIAGARVASRANPGEQTLTVATPDDPALPDGLYLLFASTLGISEFEAYAPGYGVQARLLAVQPGQALNQDFVLPAGRLVANPASLSVNVGETAPPQIIVIQNTGAISATYSISTVDLTGLAAAPAGPFADARRRVSPKRQGDLTASGVYEYVPPDAPSLPYGQVLQTLEPGLPGAWGIGLTGQGGDFWLGSAAAAGGDDRLHRLDANGRPTGGSIDLSGQPAAFSADLAYNPFSRKLWQVNVAGDNCLFELDPSAGQATGRKICPPFASSQRGLAYNPLDGTFYSASWTDGILYHFDAQGTVLDSLNLNVNVSGLAFNPASRRLYALANAALGYDVYVLDVDRDYALVGGFDVAGLGAFEQAGLEIDCQGRLWAVNQASGKILEIDAGDTPACAWSQASWFSVSPLQGVLASGGLQDLTIQFNVQAARAGPNTGRIVVENSGPYGALEIPVTLNVIRLFMPVTVR